MLAAAIAGSKLASMRLTVAAISGVTRQSWLNASLLRVKALVQGTTDVTVARSLYALFIGS